MRNWLESFRIAATLVGTIVGAGFATGKEISQFFGQYGPWGTLGVLIAGLFYMWIATKMMTLSHQIQSPSFQEFNQYLFGPKLGGLLSAITVCIMIGVTAVMLSGSGALFYEQLHLSPLIGSLLILIVCYFFLQKGINGVFAVNSLVVPFMALVIIIIAGIRFQSLSLNQWVPHFNSSTGLSLHWLSSALYYVSFNLVTTQAVLVPLGTEIKDIRNLKRGGILGGLLFCICLLGGHLALISLSSAASYDIPMAVLASEIGTLFSFLVILLIFGEILTTYVGNIYGLSKQFQSLIKLEELPILLVLLLITFTISLFDYGTLIESLYPFFGKIGLLFTVVLILKRRPITK